MKKLLILLSVLLNFKVGFGQAYTVTFIKGAIYHNNKPINLHDKLDGANQITSNDKTAEIALFSAQKGKLRLTFENSKPTPVKAGPKSSELYQLTVADYLQTYTTEKTLTTRDVFDLKKFFNYTDSKHSDNKIFLVEGEQLPDNSIAYKFFICPVKGKDTINNVVPKKNGALTFDLRTINTIARQLNGEPQPVYCLIKQGYINNNKYSEEYYPEPVKITFLTQNELKGLVDTFKEGLETYYRGNKEKLLTDVEGQLAYYYGNYHQPSVHQVLLNLLN